MFGLGGSMYDGYQGTRRCNAPVVEVNPTTSPRNGDGLEVTRLTSRLKSYAGICRTYGQRISGISTNDDVWVRNVHSLDGSPLGMEKIRPTLGASSVTDDVRGPSHLARNRGVGNISCSRTKTRRSTRVCQKIRVQTTTRTGTKIPRARRELERRSEFRHTFSLGLAEVRLELGERRHNRP